jgi:hypothetical protein
MLLDLTAIPVTADACSIEWASGVRRRGWVNYGIRRFRIDNQFIGFALE